MSGQARPLGSGVRLAASTVAVARQLLLLRHAKSSWDDPVLADHDRPLAARGRKAAKLIGALVHSQQLEVSLVLCSSARRTCQTLDLVAPPGDVQIEPQLYGASADGLLDRLRRVPDEARVVMLIGHNPAIRDLLLSLVGAAAAQPVGKFPTGALVTVTLTVPWHALAAADGELSAFVTPRQLG